MQQNTCKTAVRSCVFLEFPLQKTVNKTIHPLLWAASAYVAAQILADVASLRIVYFWGLSVDGGTLIYPLTFTLRDLVHKAGGKAAARTIILCAAAANLLMALVFWLVGILPADPSVGPQVEFAVLLTPVWRIVGASIAAEVLSELLDGEVYSAWVKKMGPRRQWLRVLVSNLTSVPLDSVIFCLGAFAFSLEWPVVWSIILANILIKVAASFISLPLIYLVPEESKTPPGS